MCSAKLQDDTRDSQEHTALTRVLDSHVQYGRWAKQQIIAPKTLKYQYLSGSEKQLLPWFPDYLIQLEHSVEINSKYFQTVACSMAANWGVGDQLPWSTATIRDFDKITGLMAQYVREWSADGEKERELSFGRILAAAERFFPEVERRSEIQVLVPGAGLGRLVVEFVSRGFCTEGNELSYHMLLNSNFLLNNTHVANNFVLCPFIHRSSHVEKRNYQNRQVFFPDMNPGDVSLIRLKYPDIPVEELMSMVAGGFTDLYGPLDLPQISDLYTDDPGAVEFRKQNVARFQIVATCYFIDTATNIIDYLQTIKSCLADSGYWINFGPLLWHFENDDNVYNVKAKNEHGEYENITTPMKGLELSKCDLIELIKDIGFEFVEHESNIDSTYGCDPRSLGSWNYKCEYWVCRKVNN